MLTLVVICSDDLAIVPMLIDISSAAAATLLDCCVVSPAASDSCWAVVDSLPDESDRCAALRVSRSTMLRSLPIRPLTRGAQLADFVLGLDRQLVGQVAVGELLEGRDRFLDGAGDQPGNEQRRRRRR